MSGGDKNVELLIEVRHVLVFDGLDGAVIGGEYRKSSFGWDLGRWKF